DLATAISSAPGTPVSDTLNPASATAAYRFTVGSAGRYFFNYQNSSGLANTYWRLIDPYGNVVFITSLFTDQGPLLLSSPGTYTLLVEGYYNDPGNGSYDFNVVPVGDGLQALTLGNVVSGAIAAPGQQQQYTFTLPGAARLYFDSLTNSGQLHWSLNGPAGNVVNNRGFNGSDAQSIGDKPLPSLAADDTPRSAAGAGNRAEERRGRAERRRGWASE